MAGRVRNIFLTGFSGTGKSHVGRIVAERLGWELVDTDELISKRAGEPIVEIFERGEKTFRKLEREVLAEVATGRQRVISTGGGIPVDERNRAVMQASGMTVRLKASPETIHRRLAEGRRGTDDPDARRGLIRPLLQRSATRGNGEDAPFARIRRLLEQRESSYATADVTIDTEGLFPREVAERVLVAWQRLSAATQEAS